MESFQLNVPTKIYFGRNCLAKGLKENRWLLSGNVLVVTTGRSLIRLGHLSRLETELKNNMPAGEIVIFGNISANPGLDEVQEGILNGIANKAAVIIGFGGGSAIDAAKAIAAGIGMRQSASDLFYGKNVISAETLPVIAIPTTAGTGSELSRAAILSDKTAKKKDGLRGEYLYPKAAFVDPAFTDTVPLKITMETGFDVFAHALETYISRAGNEVTKMLSETAIRITGEYLPKLGNNPDDREARDKMSYASMLMGINLGNASTCLPHRLQYPLGALTDTSHGRGLAAMFPAWLNYEYKYSPAKIDNAAYMLTGKKVTGAKDASGAITQFIRNLSLTNSLSDLGVTENDIAWLASEVSGNTGNDPASIEDGIILNIYRKSL